MLSDLSIQNFLLGAYKSAREDMMPDFRISKETAAFNMQLGGRWVEVQVKITSDQDEFQLPLP